MHNNFATVRVVMITVIVYLMMIGIVTMLITHGMVIMMPVSDFNFARG